MTREEAIKMIKAKLECMTRDVSGRDCDCIDRRCDECSLNYEQGNMGEQKEWLRMSIEALEQQPSENEKIIRISKGTLKARTGRYVIYDVEWLKTHFNTTEAKLYGQPNEDCISRKAVLDALHRYFANGFDGDKWWNSTHVLDAINKVPSITPQQKTGYWIEHKHGGIEHIECSKCKCWFLRKDLIRNSYCPNCGSRNHWKWELKMQEVKK